jgi:hypothetical protein
MSGEGEGEGERAGAWGIPSPSLSKRLKASLNSAIWSSVSWSAMASNPSEDLTEEGREAGRQRGEPRMEEDVWKWGREKERRKEGTVRSAVRGRSQTDRSLVVVGSTFHARDLSPPDPCCSYHTVHFLRLV